MPSLEKLDSFLLSCVFITGNIRRGGAVINGEARKLPPVYFSSEISEGGARAQCRGSTAPCCAFLIGNIRRGGAVITGEVRQLPPVYFILEISEEEVRGLFKNLHSRHAAGSDEIDPRLLTHLYPPSHIQDT